MTGISAIMPLLQMVAPRFQYVAHTYRKLRPPLLDGPWAAGKTVRDIPSCRVLEAIWALVALHAGGSAQTAPRLK